jgi:hypothetical protein
LPGRGDECDPTFIIYYQAAYDLWKMVMGHALQYESKLKESLLYSDSFLQQREILAIFSQESAVALVMLDWVDLSFVATREHSYFSAYPSSVLDELMVANYQRLMLMSHLCVHEDWRRHKIGAGTSELAIGLAISRFLSSKAQGILTHTRNDRSTHRLVYGFGGIALHEDHLSHGIYSDSILVSRQSVTPCPVPGIQTLIDELYAQRQIAHVERTLSLDAISN